MFLAEKELYKELDERGIIDKRFPHWWTTGFEDRRYVRPEEFFGGLSDFEGRKFQLGPDDKDIRFTTVMGKLYGMDVPFFVTAKPLTENEMEDIKQDGLKDTFWHTGESWPHIRGIGLSLEDYAFFWHPVKSILSLRMESHGTKLTEVYFNEEPESFFWRLIHKKMLAGKRTYYNINHSQERERMPGLPFIPFYEFSPEGKEMTIVPAGHGKLSSPDYPALIVPREGETPLIRGFTDIRNAYRIHKNLRDRVKNQVKERFGWDCAVYK